MVDVVRDSRTATELPTFTRPSARLPRISGTELGIGLGVVAVAGGALILARAGTSSGPTSGGNSASFGSIPPPKCPPCGLYREPSGAVYAVDGDAIYHWIEDELAFAQCGYNHANQHAVEYGWNTGCAQGPNVTDSCSTCPCTGPFGIVDWCATVPCPGCI